MTPNQPHHRRRAIFAAAAVAALALYSGLNAKPVSTPGGTALLWCGPNRGIYGFKPEDPNYDGPGFFSPMNGDFMARKLRAESLSETLIEDVFVGRIVENFDLAIDDECHGSKGAVERFYGQIDNLGSGGDSALSPEPSYEQDAITFIGSLNRAQQTLLLETGGFTWDINALGLANISEVTPQYLYGARLSDDGKAVVNSAQARLRGGSDVFGIVALVRLEGGEATTLAVVCRGEAPTMVAGAHQFSDGEGGISCPAGSEAI